MTREIDVATSRPRVLTLATTLPAKAGDGSAAEFVLTLAQGLARRFRILILAPRVPGSVARERIGDVAVRRFPYFPRRWEDLATDAILPTLRQRPFMAIQAPPLVLSMLVHTLSLIRRGRPDALHAHWIFPGGLVAWIAKQLYGIPYILTVHGADAYAFQIAPIQPLKRLVLGGASAVLPVSRDIANGLESSDEVLPMGVDFDAIRADVGARMPVPCRLFFLGRLAEKKGVDVLIDALAKVPGWTLRIGGDGPERTKLEAQVDRLKLRERVEFLGRLGHEDILREFRTAAAVALPSKVARDGDQDGTPVVMMEAVAAGVPVIASSLGGLGEYLDDGQTGILAAPDDVKSLVGALERAAADPDELERIGSMAHAQLRSKLSVAGVAARYSRHLERATSCEQPPARTVA